jgi:hypothetical protein
MAAVNERGSRAEVKGRPATLKPNGETCMPSETIPIPENLYSLAMALMHEGLEVEGYEGIRERLHKEVDSICDAIEYGGDD